MYIKTMILLSGTILSACETGHSQMGQQPVQTPASPGINPYANVLDIPLPPGYKRIDTIDGAYANWLRYVGLKKDKTVYLHNGNIKPNQEAQFAVLDVSVGEKNLQQCADAVMRLRAEYLFHKKQYSHIVFYDNVRKAYRFTEPYTHDHLLEYLEKVFGMCGSASLSRQLQSVRNMEDIMPGDVIIRGGFPGHAVTVMDVAMNEKGKKIYLLSQSFMPAQDIHLLINPANDELSPWYEINGTGRISTPEYTFNSNELKRW